MANVADFFIDTLKRAGVTRVWGLPGDSLNAFTDALRRDSGKDALQWMHMRHEEAAAKGPKEVTGGRGLKAHIALPHRRSECADD